VEMCGTAARVNIVRESGEAGFAWCIAMAMDVCNVIDLDPSHHRCGVSFDGTYDPMQPV